jgi:hypothetical protein
MWIWYYDLAGHWCGTYGWVLYNPVTLSVLGRCLGIYDFDWIIIPVGCIDQYKVITLLVKLSVGRIYKVCSMVSVVYCGRDKKVF